MTKEEWATRIAGVKRAVDAADELRRNVHAKVWHDNEKFLLQPSVYARRGIETVWAWLRRDLAKREQADFADKRTITPHQFRLRAAQILRSYEEPSGGQHLSRLEKLVRGMPKRLAVCKAKRYGRCGK